MLAHWLYGHGSEERVASGAASGVGGTVESKAATRRRLYGPPDVPEPEEEASTPFDGEPKSHIDTPCGDEASPPSAS